MLLGRVTHAANNHMVTVINEKGVTATSARRDATQATRTTIRRSASAQPPTVRPAATKLTLDNVQPWSASASLRSGRGPSAAATLGARMRSAAEANVFRRVEEVGAALSTPVGRQSATEKLEQLTQRVRCRVGSGSA
jgi:hypothetical protein